VQVLVLLGAVIVGWLWEAAWVHHLACAMHDNTISGMPILTLIGVLAAKRWRRMHCFPRKITGEHGGEEHQDKPQRAHLSTTTS